MSRNIPIPERGQYLFPTSANIRIIANVSFDACTGVLFKTFGMGRFEQLYSFLLGKSFLKATSHSNPLFPSLTKLKQKEHVYPSAVTGQYLCLDKLWFSAVDNDVS